MHNTAQDNSAWRFWVEELELKPHPEGGYFKETYRSEESISQQALPKRFKGNRAFSTSIYFLLAEGEFSAFHRIAADEIWHFYQGNTLIVYVIYPSGELKEFHLGDAPLNGEVFQVVVPAGCWFASKPAREDAWSLVGCTVAPGFDFDDFEMATTESLSREYPQHSNVIKDLCRK